jgi:Ni,Fe-hydrogenase maturation factor
MDYWETHIIVVDAGDINPLTPGEKLTIEGEWYTADEYAAHDHAEKWPVWRSVTFEMDEYENIEVISGPVTSSGIGYRILD